MKAVTIGYVRGDGDLATLVAINNTDEHLTDREMQKLVQAVVTAYSEVTGLPVQAYEREDLIDYITPADKGDPFGKVIEIA